MSKPTKVKATVTREIHHHPGRRPEFFVVVSHSPHAAGSWQISNLFTREDGAKECVRRHDLARATIVRIPAEDGL